jgi:RNA recognition motif-containing protein
VGFLPMVRFRNPSLSLVFYDIDVPLLALRHAIPHEEEAHGVVHPCYSPSFTAHVPPSMHAVTDDELRGFFAQFGPVFEAVIMFDRTTGRSRGFGFVTFHDQAVRTRLLQELHPNHGRLSMRDRTIEVKPAQPKAFVMPSAAPVVPVATTPPAYNDNDHGGTTSAPHNENQNLSSYGVGLATNGPSALNQIGTNNNNNDSSYAEYYYSQYQASLQHFREQQQHRQYQQQQQVYYYPDPSASITPSAAAAAYSEYYAPPPSPPLTQYPYPNCALPPTLFYPLSHQ